MKRKIIYVDFIRKRKINLIHFIINRIISLFITNLNTKTSYKKDLEIKKNKQITS